MAKFRFNPLTGEFDLVEPKDDAFGISLEFDTDASTAIGDIVKESLTVDNKVETSIDNTSDNRAIGVVIDKPSITTALVKVLGQVDGFSGLTKGREIFLHTTGGITSVPPLTGYVQLMGYATSATEIFLEPGNTRMKRTP